jgi:LacI family repressor for deo operon, udp, cdd, tsx, nupC, and nupG
MGQTTKKGKVTIYDIAKEAGVSTATISRVINHSPSVDYETRRRIIELCAKLNYRPRIVKNKEPHVGVLIEHHVQLQMGLSDYFAGIVSGATEYAYQQKLELSVLLFESEDLRNPEDVVAFLLEKDVSGAIFVAPPMDADYIYALHRIGFPYLSIASRFHSEEINSLRTDNMAGVVSSVRYLHDLGHRRIGFITVDMDHFDAIERQEAYLRTLEQLNLPMEPHYLVRLPSNTTDHKKLGNDAVQVILQDRSTLPTAYICLNDDLAMGIIRGLSDRGISVPADLSIVGFDDYPYARYMVPALTTVRNRIYDMGYLGCEIVDYWIRGKKPKTSKVLESQLIIRNSCQSPAKNNT